MNAEHRAALDAAWSDVHRAHELLFDAQSAKRDRETRIWKAERNLKIAQLGLEGLVRDIASEDVDELVHAYGKGKQYAYEQVAASEPNPDLRRRWLSLAASAVLQ